ncbi:MAG: hypothetical protein E7320_07000 [Clostridiales bacterium]|nr:hypothetical protein [Clostridiales bacterium]
MNRNKQTAKAKKRATWGQWLMVACYLLFGAFFGILMVQTMDTASLNYATDGQVLLIWLALLVGLYVIFFLEIVLHEAGHLVFGLLTGYGFVSFRVGSLMLLKNEQGWRVRKFRLGGTGGQCLLDPPPIIDGKMPHVLYNLGGVIVNLIAAVVCFGCTFLCEDGTLVHALLVTAACVGLLFALTNGLPVPMEQANDGRNALDLGKEPEALTAFRTQLVVNKLNVNGMRLKDMPAEYFVWPGQESRSNVLIAGIAILCANRLLDGHRFGECAVRLDEMLADEPEKLPGMFRKLLLNDRIYLHLLEGESEIAQQLMTKEQLKFMKVMNGQLPIHRTAYAYALLAEGNSANAEWALEEFEKAAKNYPHEQEIASERELIALAQQQAEA